MSTKEYSNKLRKTSTNKPGPSPHWDLYRDGVTQSLLAKFLICRHRFWIRTVLGLEQDSGFNHRMEYGSMLHAGFEAFARAKNGIKFDFEKALKAGVAGVNSYGDFLLRKYPKADTVNFWKRIGIAQFKLYCNFWKKQDAKRRYLLQEEVFAVPVELPSGRVVTLRGKFDEVFEQDGKIVLQENKCKGEVDDEGISSSLNQDLQTMLYMASLNRSGLLGRNRCCDLLYNVMQRPNGGRFPLRQKKTENQAEFADRILEGIEANPRSVFYRWNVHFQPKEIENFENRTLFPILEQLCDWWDSIKSNPTDPWTARYSDGFLAEAGPGHPSTYPNPYHFARPFGIFDSLALGNRGDYFDFLISEGKNRVGLKQSPLFQELTDPSLSGK